MSISELDEPVVPVYRSRRERRAAERAAELAERLAAGIDLAEPTPSAEEAFQDVLTPLADADEAPVAIIALPAPIADAPATGDADAPSNGASTAEPAVPEHVAPRGTRPSGARRRRRTTPRSKHGNRPRVLRGLMSAGAATFAAALAIGLSIPASLFGTAEASSATAADATTATATGGGEAAPKLAQGLDVSDSIIAAEAAGPRDGYSSESYVSVAQANFQAAGVGIDPGYVEATTSIGWPFDHAVPISSGYGLRADGEFHYGIDLDPGEGAPIGAIADGVVTWVGWDGTGYGYYVVVAHNIDGVRVDSLYGHMIDGSSSVYPGQHVTRGTILGLTGNTGYSFGAHCHLEIHVAGEYVDPYPWMIAHADNDFTEPTPGAP